MVYQGRAAALAPIYLLHHDFTVEEDPKVLAQDANLDVRGFAWAPTGTHGVGLYDDLLVSIEPGKEKRQLAPDQSISTVTFGPDGSTVYAVRIAADGANDVATILEIDFASGDTSELASISYARPDIGDEDALAEAQFADEGGTVRIYWMEDGVLRLWALGAGTWEIDPENGDVTELEEALPTLWGPDGDHRIGLKLEDEVTTISLLDADDEPEASTTIDGRVSHVRWSPKGNRVVFTVGRSTSGGGVIQNLYLWDLGDGEDPMQLTPTGAAFGAEWLGSPPLWRD
jgi:WD40 repeat protein